MIWAASESAQLSPKETWRKYLGLRVFLDATFETLKRL